jgi:hypothetical protein
MVRPITELLGQARVLSEQSARGLQVFGIHWVLPRGPDYLVLDEALGAKVLEVTEISQGGSVPLLKVTNHGATPVFLMAGEQLIGAKQNRVLSVSLLVPGKQDSTIPVSCVEAGRWTYHSPKFTSKGNMSHGKLRKMMSQHAEESYRAAAMPFSKQGEVWGEVARKLKAVQTVSHTAALDQAYVDHQRELEQAVHDLKPAKYCAGAAFAVGGRIAAADIFDRPATLCKLWPKLIRAYALDALEYHSTRAAGFNPAGCAITPEAVQAWLSLAASARTTAFKSPALGEDIRFSGNAMHGAALWVDNRPIHVELFAE